MRNGLFYGIVDILFMLALNTAQGFGMQAAPPKQVPQGLEGQFTLNGRIPLSHWYLNDSYSPTTPILFTTEQVNVNLAKISRREWNYYGATDGYLYSALEKYNGAFRGKKVAIIGSATPWYESIVLFYGGIPTTIEYNKIICTDSRLNILTVEEYEKNPQLFDVILSISSIEHDGLGRYGDPIHPFGDCIAMQKQRSMLAKGGLLLLSVPIGKDLLSWNSHRVYGRIRFPMLIEGWECIDSFGFQNADFDCDRGYHHQPVFVLKGLEMRLP